MSVYKTKEFLNFFITNFVVVNLASFAAIDSHNGHGNDFPLFLIPSVVIISSLIILMQYRFLNKNIKWIWKIMIFYLSMVVFLFLFGITLSWNSSVGSNPAGSILARLDGGLRMMIFGQVFGGLFFFPMVVFINYLLKDKFFKTIKNSI